MSEEEDGGTAEAMAKYAAALLKLVQTKDKGLLESVHIKGEGYGCYYSVTDKKFLMVPKTGEMYLLPWAKDEKGRFAVFTPYKFSKGAILLIPEEEMEVLGFN
jgi:hypothetical protein|tara:strand:- start:2812 stop:3120 length:309 start_codon:yes stop_codon:yes gene_type:complete